MNLERLLVHNNIILDKKNMVKIFYLAFIAMAFSISSMFAEEMVAEEKKDKGAKNGERLEKHFKALDADESGDVSLQEFLDHKRKHKKGPKKEGENGEAGDAPEKKKGEGRKGERSKRKGPKMSKEEMKTKKTEAFKTADADESGALSKEEFKNMMKAFMKKMKENRGGSKKNKEAAEEE